MQVERFETQLLILKALKENGPMSILMLEEFIGRRVEKSVKSLINDSYNNVIKIICENKEYLQQIKEILVEKEVIDDDDLCQVLSIKTAC